MLPDSDRGCRYCRHAYVGELNKYGMGISMTEENHCYENGLAERVNGILKQEYALGGEFKGKAAVRLAISETVRLFNTRRPRLALAYQTPDQAHSLQKAA